jgi:transcriptional regulator with XRE-family HTH domain
MDARAKIGRNVRELREQRDLTQTQLAEKAGVNIMTVSRAERGEHAPSTNTLVRLAEALDVPLSALLD